MNTTSLYKAGTSKTRMLAAIAVIAMFLTASCGVAIFAIDSDASVSDSRIETLDPYNELQEFDDQELLEAYLLLINYVREINFELNENGEIVANIAGPAIMPMGGTTGVDTYHEGIIIKLDSKMCEQLYGYGTTAAGAALMGALGAAIGSAVPALGTTIGTVAFSVIGALATKAIFDYIESGMDYGNGISIKIKLVGYAYGIPYPFPPTVKEVTPQ